MALVFTAIADSTCGLLLHARGQRVLFNVNGRLIENIDTYQLVATAIMSVGLYGFGMSLNDIIDRRRDSQSHRTARCPGPHRRRHRARHLPPARALGRSWGRHTSSTPAPPTAGRPSSWSSPPDC